MMHFMSLMAMQVIDKIRATNKCQSGIEEFVSSKRPSSAAEAEYWMREYDRKQSRSGWNL
jgi:hypothetical protein